MPDIDITDPETGTKYNVGWGGSRPPNDQDIEDILGTLRKANPSAPKPMGGPMGFVDTRAGQAQPSGGSGGVIGQAANMMSAVAAALPKGTPPQSKPYQTTNPLLNGQYSQQQPPAQGPKTYPVTKPKKSKLRNPVDIVRGGPPPPPDAQGPKVYPPGAPAPLIPPATTGFADEWDPVTGLTQSEADSANPQGEQIKVPLGANDSAIHASQQRASTQAYHNMNAFQVLGKVVQPIANVVTRNWGEIENYLRSQGVPERQIQLQMDEFAKVLGMAVTGEIPGHAITTAQAFNTAISQVNPNASPEEKLGELAQLGLFSLPQAISHLQPYISKFFNDNVGTETLFRGIDKKTGKPIYQDVRVGKGVQDFAPTTPVQKDLFTRAAENNPKAGFPNAPQPGDGIINIGALKDAEGAPHRSRLADVETPVEDPVATEQALRDRLNPGGNDAAPAAPTSESFWDANKRRIDELEKSINASNRGMKSKQAGALSIGADDVELLARKVLDVVYRTGRNIADVVREMVPSGLRDHVHASINRVTSMSLPQDERSLKSASVSDTGRGLGDKTTKVGFTISDAAHTGEATLPSGGTVNMYGGPGYRLQGADPLVGDGNAWASSSEGISNKHHAKAAKGAEIQIAVANSEDNVLASHGSLAIRSEVEHAIATGSVSKKDILAHARQAVENFNKTEDGRKAPLPIPSSIDNFLKSIDSIDTFSGRMQMSKNFWTSPRNGKATNPFGAGWKEVAGALRDPGAGDRAMGEASSVLWVDPAGRAAQDSAHPIYPWSIKGENLGMSASSDISEIVPQLFGPAGDRLRNIGRPVTPANVRNMVRGWLTMGHGELLPGGIAEVPTQKLVSFIEGNRARLAEIESKPSQISRLGKRGGAVDPDAVEYIARKALQVVYDTGASFVDAVKTLAAHLGYGDDAVAQAIKYAGDLKAAHFSPDDVSKSPKLDAALEPSAIPKESVTESAGPATESGTQPIIETSANPIQPKGGKGAFTEGEAPAAAPRRAVTEPAPEEGTRFRHEDTEKLRQDLGLAEYAKTSQSFDETLKKAHEGGQVADAEKIVNSILENPRPMSDTEHVASAIHAQEQGKIANDAIDRAVKLIESGDTEGARLAHATYVEAATKQYRAIEAMDKAGSEWGRSGRMRQNFIKADYSQEAIEKRWMVAKEGPLTQIDRIKAREMSEALETQRQKLESETINAQKKQVSRQMKQAAVNRVKEAYKGTYNRRVSREAYDEAKSAWFKSETTNIGLTAKQADALVTMAKYHTERLIETGKASYEAVATAIKTDLKGFNLDDADILTAIEEASRAHAQQLNKGRSFGEDIHISGKDGIQSPQIAKLRKELDALREEIGRTKEGAPLTPKQKVQKQVEDQLAQLERKIESEKERSEGLKGQDKSSQSPAQRTSVAQQIQKAEQAQIRLEKQRAAVQAKLDKQLQQLEQKLNNKNAPKVKGAPKVSVSTQLSNATKTIAAMQEKLDQLEGQIGKSKTIAEQEGLLSEMQDLGRKLSQGRGLGESVLQAGDNAIDDPSVLSARLKYDELKGKIDRETARLRYEANPDKRTIGEWIGLYGQANVLTSPGIFAKLTSAAYQGQILDALGNLSASTAQKILFPRADAVIPDFSVAREAAAFQTMFSKRAWEEAWRVVKTGESTIDTAIHEIKGEWSPQHIFSFIKNAHGALKTPRKIAAFEQSMSEQFALAAKKGIPPPPMQEMMIKAYAHANEAIFMNDNAVSKLWSGAMRTISTFGKTGKNLAGVMKFVEPVTRVGPNIVGRTFESAFGLPVAGAETLVRAVTGTLDETARARILKLIKRGTPGGALLALGYVNPDAIQVGASYRRGAAPDERGLKPGEVRILGWHVPHSLAHGTIIDLLVMGASLRRSFDEAAPKGTQGKLAAGQGKNALGQSAYSLAATALDNNPISDVVGKADQLTSEGKGAKLLASVAGQFVPASGLMGAIAKTMDPSDRRIAKTAPEGFKSNIPVLRESVPNQPEGMTLSNKTLNWLRENGYEPATIKQGKHETDEMLDSKKESVSNLINDIVTKTQSNPPEGFDNWPISKRKVYIATMIKNALGVRRRVLSGVVRK